MNWTAAEANWLLIMDPTAASNYDIVEAAVFITADKRGARPGPWAEDEYVGIDFMTVTMTAADQHEEANEQRDEEENPDFNRASSVPEVDEFDLTQFADELRQFVQEQEASDSEREKSDDDDGATAQGGAPPGAPPEYRAREAAAMAEEESESEEEETRRKPRSRYVDDEADDTPEI